MSRSAALPLSAAAIAAAVVVFAAQQAPRVATPTVTDVGDLPRPAEIVPTRPGAPGDAPPAPPDDAWRIVELGVAVADLVEGQGTPSTPGDLCAFDVALWHGADRVANTWELRAPMKARIGAGQTAPGLEVALLGMAPGGRRAVRLPAAAGFGPTGPEGVPDADLVAELAIVSCEATRHVPSAPPRVGADEGAEIAAGVRVVDRAVGVGPEAAPDLVATLDLAVWTADGTLIDASQARGRATRVVLGRRSVLPAIEQVILGMRPGGHRVARISAAAAADPAAGARMPTETDLLVDVTLTHLEPAP